MTPGNAARPRLSRQFVTFAAAGVAGFLVDAAVLYALAPWLGWYAGRVVSFWAAATTTWLINRRYTFGAARARGAGAVAREYGRYLATMLGGAALNYAAYVAVLRWAPVPHAAFWGVAAGAVAGMAVNFLMARAVVFRHRPPPAG